jgi:homeobox domain-containing protein
MDTTCPSCYLLSAPCTCFKHPVRGNPQPATTPQRPVLNASESLAPAAKGKRKRFHAAERDILWAQFRLNPYPSTELRRALAQQLNVTARCVQTWFQNARAKLKSEKGADM